MSFAWNPYLAQLPHREGEFKDHGVIFFFDDPKLFRLSGHEILTWKDGINGDFTPDRETN